MKFHAEIECNIKMRELASIVSIELYECHLEL